MATPESRTKDYNAVLDIIMEPGELSESMKRIFANICHEPVEQLIYDEVIYDKKGSLEEKGAELYYIHSKLNVKLGRCDYFTRNSCDDYLLGCIVDEIKRRKPEYVNEPKKELMHKIYREFQNTDYSKDEDGLRHVVRDELFDNFDDYIKYLFTKERNGLIEIHSFNYLWNRLGLRRDRTFEKIRPTQDELYIFCFALALDYDVYCRLKRFLMKEMTERSEMDGKEKTPKFRSKLKGFTHSDRDDVLKHFLKNIETRLACAQNDLKGCVDFIPGRMVENVNFDLQRMREEQGNPALYPLTVKGKKCMKLAHREDN